MVSQYNDGSFVKKIDALINKLCSRTDPKCNSIILPPSMKDVLDIISCDAEIATGAYIEKTYQMAQWTSKYRLQMLRKIGTSKERCRTNNPNLTRLNFLIFQNQCLCVTLYRLVHAQLILTIDKFKLQQKQHYKKNTNSHRRLNGFRLLGARALANCGKILAQMEKYGFVNNIGITILESFENSALHLSELPRKTSFLALEIKVRMYSVCVLSSKNLALECTCSKAISHLMRILVIFKLLLPFNHLAIKTMQKNLMGLMNSKHSARFKISRAGFITIETYNIEFFRVILVV